MIRRPDRGTNILIWFIMPFLAVHMALAELTIKLVHPEDGNPKVKKMEETFTAILVGFILLLGIIAALVYIILAVVY